ncbi:MAG: hypothetical protein HOC91_15670 [Nitrospinaceae bacterium]|jgi:uncharacterized OsmC-like protein|nr:hypothetical protein [Nitrospinaceae bacterium]MBT4431947.1 hypothetical protein [Nitrospinaceae bacterium]MBT5947832.1 hypothetical protein [Nitrospinaceae bacterium]MBT6395128.1 hypothetical protein [Nitrospinaceae bacterium]
MMKIEIKSASCRVEMDYFMKGSVLKGTVESGCTESRTLFRVESDAPPEKIALLIRNAKQGCYAEQMIETAVPLKSEVELNGASLALDGITE